MANAASFVTLVLWWAIFHVAARSELAALSAVIPDLAVDALLRAARGERDLRLRLRNEALLSILIYAGVRVQATRAVGGGNFPYRQVSSPNGAFPPMLYAG
jgi:hypothetical protein